MKFFLPFVLSVFFMNVALAQSTTANASSYRGIQFHHGDWASVLAEAQRLQKPIFVDVYTTWCGPCKQMAKTVFLDNAVGERYNAAFINYKIDAEKGEGIALAKEYAVQAFPTYLFVNAQGELVYKEKGACPADKFLAHADRALIQLKARPLATLDKLYADGQRDTAFFREYLQARNLKGLDNEAVLNAYLAALPESLHETKDVLMLIAASITLCKGRPFELLQLNKRNYADQQLAFAVSRGISQAKNMTLKRAIAERNPALLETVLAAERKDGLPPNHQFKSQLDYAFGTKDKDLYRQVAETQGALLMLEKKEDLLKKDSASFEMQMKALQSTDRGREMLKTRPELITASKNIHTTVTASQLGTLATGYIKLMTDPKDLEKALIWIDKALELKTEYYTLNTKAQILYMLERKKEAIDVQQAAVKAAKETPEVSKQEEVLQQMKDGAFEVKK